MSKAFDPAFECDKTKGWCEWHKSGTSSKYAHAVELDALVVKYHRKDDSPAVKIKRRFIMIDVVMIETQDETTLEKLQDYLHPSGIQVHEKGHCEFLASVPDSNDALDTVTDLLNDNGVDCYVCYP